MSKSYISAICNAVDAFSDAHGGYEPEKILVHPDILNDIIYKMKSSGHKWNNYLWDIPVIEDGNIKVPFKLVGAPVLEHKKCMLCGIVVGMRVRGHKLNGKWVCEHCYDKITRNMGVMNSKWQKIMRENNERVAQAMDKNYFEAYKEMLFGDTANWFNFKEE